MTTPDGTGAPQAGTGTGQQAPQAGPAQQGQDTSTPEGQQGTQTGQEPEGGQQAQQESATAWLDSITDPDVRARVETQIRDAAEARREAARYRTERNTLDQQVKEAQRANETAEQTAQREQAERDAERERLVQENRDLKAQGAIQEALAKAKPHNPQTVQDLIKPRLQYGEDGKPTNLPTVMSALLKSDPYLFQSTDAGGGDGGQEQQTPAGTSSVNDFIRGGRRATAR